MSYECNEGLERALVLVKVATDTIATSWGGLDHAGRRDREYLINCLERELSALQKAVAGLIDPSQEAA